MPTAPLPLSIAAAAPPTQLPCPVWSHLPSPFEQLTPPEIRRSVWPLSRPVSITAMSTSGLSSLPSIFAVGLRSAPTRRIALSTACTPSFDPRSGIETEIVWSGVIDTTEAFVAIFLTWSRPRLPPHVLRPS